MWIIRFQFILRSKTTKPPTTQRRDGIEGARHETSPTDKRTMDATEEVFISTFTYRRLSDIGRRPYRLCLLQKLNQIFIFPIALYIHTYIHTYLFSE